MSRQACVLYARQLEEFSFLANQGKKEQNALHVIKSLIYSKKFTLPSTNLP
jgi:hypothetical protein